MALETDLAGIVREVVQFLENLRDAKLPVALENVREKLLARSKGALAAAAKLTVARSASPEPYLNMNAGPRGWLHTGADAELEEYVGADEPRLPSGQDYYETFQDVEFAKSPAEVAANDRRDGKRDDARDTIIDVYANLPAARVKDSCYKCGPLYRRDGKKLFMFEQYRAYWVGLVGTRLLIYGSERDARPCAIQPIRGYMARPAPGANPRDQRKSESTFEIFCPGSKTLQFIARTPKDMEQWVAKICEVGCGEANENPGKDLPDADIVPSESRSETSKRKADRDKNTLSANDTKDAAGVPKRSPLPERGDAARTNGEADVSSTNANPPPLPARIPRRLPSLPADESISSYEPVEDDEDDIYHRIEDLKDSTRYQNMLVAKRSKRTECDRVADADTYDDVHTRKTPDRERHGNAARDKEEQSRRELVVQEETYDDVESAITKDRSKKGQADEKRVGEDKQELPAYDDVESLLGGHKSCREQAKARADDESPEKSPQKRSFLDRVRNRKDSPLKADKKAKRKTPTPPAMSVEELPTYDDVSDLPSKRDNVARAEELPEYNCPPPPRPIYAKPPAVGVVDDCEEFYDDIGECRARYKEDEAANKPDQLRKTPDASLSTSNEEPRESGVVEETTGDDVEHYLSPKGYPRQIQQSVQEEESLYDDIAILADFTARRRESAGKRDGESSKTSNSPDKKPWNRFVSSRKSRTFETGGSDGSVRSSGEQEDANSLEEQQGLLRMNTFQKLINKMENSLGKSASKSGPTLATSKASAAQNA